MGVDVSAGAEQAADAGRQAQRERVGRAADELSDAALDAIVGGLTSAAALARAVAFEQAGRTGR